MADRIWRCCCRLTPVVDGETSNDLWPVGPCAEDLRMSHGQALSTKDCYLLGSCFPCPIAVRLDLRVRRRCAFLLLRIARMRDQRAPMEARRFRPCADSDSALEDAGRLARSEFE